MSTCLRPYQTSQNWIQQSGSCDGKKVPTKALKGEGAFTYIRHLTDSQYLRRDDTYDYVDLVMEPMERTVAAVINQVILKPAPHPISIHLDKDDDKDIIISPEKHSTEYLLGRSKYITIEVTGQGQKKSKTLQISDNTKKELNKPTEYQIDLVANREHSFAVGFGSRIIITEKDDISAVDRSNNRKGKYYFSFFPTYTKDHKKNLLAELEAKKSEYQANLEKETAALKIAEQKYKDAGEKDASSRVWYGHDVDMDRIQEGIDNAAKELEAAKKVYQDSYTKKHTTENMLNEFTRLVTEEKTIEYYDAKQLKIKLSKENNVLVMELGKNSPKNKNLLTSSIIKIKDIKRKVEINFLEHFTVNGNEEKTQCSYEINIDPTSNTPQIKLTKIRGLGFDRSDLIKPKLEKLIKQLKTNNPELITEESIVITDLDFSHASPISVGDVSGKSETNNYEQNHAGHALVTNLNRSKRSVITVAAERDTYINNKELLTGLDILAQDKIINRNEVPPEYLPLYDTLPKEDHIVTHLYNPHAKLLITQFLNAPLRLKEDATFCTDGTELKKFTRSGGQSPSYQCVGNEFVDIKNKIEQCQSLNSQCKNIFDLIIREQNEGKLPTEIFLLNPGILSSEDSTIAKPLLMNFQGGTKPRLLVMEKDENKKSGVILENTEFNYVLLGEEVTTSDGADLAKLERINEKRAKLNLAPSGIIKLFTISLFSGENLNTLSDKIISNDIDKNGMPKEILPKPIDILPGFKITSFRKNLEQGFICETLEGVGFTLSHDLTKTHLLSVSGDYLQDNNIDPANPQQLKSEYEKLIAKYGEPKFRFVKLSDGEITTGDTKQKNIIFIDAETKELLFIPNTVNMSVRSFLLATLKKGSKTVELTAVDPETKTIYTVKNPAEQDKVTLGKSCGYDYFYDKKDQVFMTLSSFQGEKELPYLPVKQLYIFPETQKSAETAEAQETSLKITKTMQQQLKSLTLLPASPDAEKPTEIKIESDKRPVKSFISKTGDTNRAYIAIPKSVFENQGKPTLSFLSGSLDDLSTQYLFIHLYNALDDDGQPKSDLKDKFKIVHNNVELDIQDLLENAQELPDE